MASSDVWYISERAEQLAIVYLTRLDELRVVKRTDLHSNLDYLVLIETSGHETQPRFGVVVKGLLTTLANQADANRIDAHHLTDLELAQYQSDHDIPICLLVFIMEDDRGWYRWLREPIITDERQGILHDHPIGVLQELNTDVLRRLVTQVTEWYSVRASHISGC
jgi:hypothetical protein